MDLPLRLRTALIAFALSFHGMGLCVAAGNEASAVQMQPEPGVGATGPAGTVAPTLALP